jgi:hypothetical protein
MFALAALVLSFAIAVVIARTFADYKIALLARRFWGAQAASLSFLAALPKSFSKVQ